MTDLVLRGGRVIDPASGRDETADIAFRDGKVTEIARDLPASGAEIVDVRGLIVAPGLIDLHTHVYWGGTSLGVEAVEVARQSGTTTFVDAGSAGAGTFHGFRRHVIEQSPLRIIPYLNVSLSRHLRRQRRRDGRRMRRSAAPRCARVRSRHWG